MPYPVKKGSFKSFDGTKISYRIAGKGKNNLLCFNGVGVAKWVWKDFEKYFADKYRIITWDYRGHGESATPKDHDLVTFDDLVEDSILLIKHLRLRKAHLIGHSAGFHVAMETYREKPKFAESLISCLGTPGRTLEFFMDSFLGKLVFDVGYIVNAVLPETSHLINTSLLKNPATYHIAALLRLVNPAIEGKENVEGYIDHFRSMNFSIFNQIVATESKTDEDDFFDQVKVPTLIIASEYDKFVPLNIAQEMHKNIKHSELFVIKNGTHAALLEQPDIFNLLVEKFLG